MLKTVLSYAAFLQLGCIQGLPDFADQGNHSPSLLVGIQALVPTYQFRCHGKVTRWGIAIERWGKNSISLQVWRATSRYGYSLVGTNNFDVEPPKNQKAFYISPPTMDQIIVQPGDIIGFYLQNNATIDDDFSIQYKPYTNNVTVHFVMTDEPLTIIEETTLSIQMSKTAPIIAVDIGKHHFLLHLGIAQSTSVASPPGFSEHARLSCQLFISLGCLAITYK